MTGWSMEMLIRLLVIRCGAKSVFGAALFLAFCLISTGVVINNGGGPYDADECIWGEQVDDGPGGMQRIPSAG